MFAPWRSSLACALHRNRALPYARYLQLATVKANGQPANRTIVFRGFLDWADQLKFVSDARSQKADQIDANPLGEACWYFPNTREQFRISGFLKLLRVDQADPELQQLRQVAWQELSDSARIQFAWSHPAKLRSEDDSFDPPPPDPTQPLPHFCLLLLEPTQVDHLELRGNPQNRWLYSRQDDRSWSTEAINP